MRFTTLAAYFQKLESTPSRNAMTEILAEVFRQAEREEIGKLCYLLQGRVVPLYEPLEFGMADKFIIRAIALAYAKQTEEVAKSFKKYGDLGSAAESLYQGKSTSIDVVGVYEALLDIAKAHGEGSQDKKIQLLAQLLGKVDALGARYIARIPLDKLRLGFSEMTILDSLSWMLTGDKSLRVKLEDAFNVRPDIGFIARTVKKDGIGALSHIKARVGSPVLAELCQRLPNADEMIKKMGEVAVEPKYDGVRVQIHYKKAGLSPGKRVATYSRNLENTTEMFPELEQIVDQVSATSVILDCEAVGYDSVSGKISSFQETTTRKRKHGIEAAQKTVPLKFFVFDILYKNDADLLDTPLVDRRAILAQTIKQGPFLEISPQIVTDKPDDIRKYHNEQIKKGLEGAVVKKWNSTYEPGRRGFSWVKFKEEEGKTGKLTDTIDAVVMGYYLGEGKRAGFGIGAFLVGVGDGDSFVTVTKIGTGVSDELWRELKKQFNENKVATIPIQYKNVDKIFTPDVWISPQVVVEIAGDDLTKSPTHGAGYAVRFPRLVRIRTDKKTSQVTSVSEIQRMFTNQTSPTKA